jgi:hypothetical protein
MDENYATLNTETPVAFEVLFSELGTGLDMSSVEAIHLHVCSENRDMDYGIDKIQAVPEPAVMSLIGLSGAFALLIRRIFCR